MLLRTIATLTSIAPRSTKHKLIQHITRELQRLRCHLHWCTPCVQPRTNNGLSEKPISAVRVQTLEYQCNCRTKSTYFLLIVDSTRRPHLTQMNHSARQEGTLTASPHTSPVDQLSKYNAALAHISQNVANSVQTCRSNLLCHFQSSTETPQIFFASKIQQLLDLRPYSH